MTRPAEAAIAPAQRPSGRPSMRMRWLHLLFMHWPVPVETVRPHVPPDLAIDTFDGTAWVGLIPFTMNGVRHVGMPPIPTMHSFHECNVRTYVSVNGERGVWFFSLDAVSGLAVWGARTFWNLNYVWSRIDMRTSGNRVEYAVRRRCAPEVSMRCAWSADEAPLAKDPDSLEWFLTERYMLYTTTRRGALKRGRIWHTRWGLHPAELHELDDGLVAAAGIEVSGDPVVYASPGVETEAWGLEGVA